MPFAPTQMDPEIIILSEVNQMQKDKYHMISLMCGILKQGTNEHIYKTDVESQVQKTNLGYQGRGEGVDWEFRIDIYTLVHIKQVTNKNLLYSTGNSILCNDLYGKRT